MTPAQVERLFKLFTMAFVALIGLLAAGIAVRALLLKEAQAREERQQRALVADVRPLVSTCQSMPGSAAVIPVRGKVLIWDLRTDSREGQDGVPEELRAVPGDLEVTVFMIVGEHAVPVRDGNGQPCEQLFRQEVDVCVAYWPQKQAVGSYSAPGRMIHFG
jgi:hypothetical protein